MTIASVADMDLRVFHKTKSRFLKHSADKELSVDERGHYQFHGNYDVRKVDNFITIPTYLCRDKRLSGTDFIVLFALFVHQNNEDGKCCPSTALIRRGTGLHRVVICRAIKRLIEFGIIEKNDGQYTLPTPDSETRYIEKKARNRRRKSMVNNGDSGHYQSVTIWTPPPVTIWTPPCNNLDTPPRNNLDTPCEQINKEQINLTDKKENIPARTHARTREINPLETAKKEEAKPWETQKQISELLNTIVEKTAVPKEEPTKPGVTARELKEAKMARRKVDTEQRIKDVNLLVYGKEQK